MKYTNPIIRGFYPDPSVCSANGKYYLASSSFQYFPGVPIFESTDLVNWKQIGYAITRSSQVKLSGVPSSGGIFAPTLRFHNGRFYMVTNNNSANENYYIYTDDIYGDWSDPIIVDQDGIDPSLLFDDGHVYFISNGSDENGQGVINQCEIDVTTGQKLSETKAIWSGTGGRYLESPHMYHIGSWYYLIAAEGGTEYGHMVTYARSKSVWGPFESYSGNPVLTNRNKAPFIIQGIGHGDLIQRVGVHERIAESGNNAGLDGVAESDDNDTYVEDYRYGDWFIITLGFRQISLWQPYHHLGREVFLTPVKFDDDGWFTAGIDGTTDAEYEISISDDSGSITAGLAEDNLAEDNFAEDNLAEDVITFENTDWNIDWCYMRIPEYDNYVLENDRAILKGSHVSLFETESPTFIALRQRDFDFSLSVKVKISELHSLEEHSLEEHSLEEHSFEEHSFEEHGLEGYGLEEHSFESDNNEIYTAEGGITIYQDENEHYDIALVKEASGYAAVLKLNLGGIRHVEKSIPLSSDEAEFKIKAEALGYHFSMMKDDEEIKLGYGRSQFLSSEVCGGFTGVMIGLYAYGKCCTEFEHFSLKYN